MGIEKVVGSIILLICAIPIFIALGNVISTVGSTNCPSCPSCEACNYSYYELKMNECNNTVNNLTQKLNETPVQYVQNITYVNVPIEKVVYHESITSVIITSVFLTLSLALSVSLFKVEIKLPAKLEKAFKKYDWIIKAIKRVSIILTILIFLRLVFIFINM